MLNQNDPANYIKNGSNHLTLNSSGNGITNSTTEADATKWIIDNNGYIYVEVEGATSVERRYVSVSGGALTVTASQSTAWTFDETSNRLYCTVSGQTYYLAYDSGWNVVTNSQSYYLTNNGNYLTVENGKLITSSTPVLWYQESNGYYTTINNVTYHIDNNGTLSGVMFIHDTAGNYLTVSGGALANSTTQNDAAVWYFSGNSSTVYTVVGNTTYYLYNNNNTLGISTSNPTTWTIDQTNNNISNNSRYVFYNGSRWVLTTTQVNAVSDGKGHYVYISGGNLHTTNDPKLASDFVASGNNLTVYADNTYYSYTVDNGRILNGNNMLYYDNDSFKWVEASYKVITDNNGNYLSINGSNITNTNRENATHWTFSNGDRGTISAGKNYLSYTTRSWGIPNDLKIESNSGTNWSNNGNLYYDGILGNYYINFSNNNWTINNGSGNAAIETIPITSNTQQTALIRSPVTAFAANTLSYTAADTGDTSISFTATTYRPFTVTMTSEPVGETYFPLQIDVDSSKSDASRFSVNSKNTGYVISGYTDSGGDIRVSEYERDRISASLTNNRLDNAKVRTIMGGTDQLISNYGLSNFVKYTASSTTMYNTIANDSYIYGLHFMNATISKDSLVVAPSIMINGQTYTDYQMPKDTIDFNLKEKGYINFFAGTYFSGNNSFFSLHRIERYQEGDQLPEGMKVNDIKTIKEIIEIYGNGNKRSPYIYKLSDGTNTTYESWTYYPSGKLKQHDTYSSIPTGYSRVFDTAWIKKQSELTDKAVYYFEIPADAGEYALGSVNEGTGAYLMYLDIGTGGSEKAPEGNSELLLNGYNVFSAYKELSSITYYEVSTETRNERFNSYPTYFPLAWDNGAVSNSNTGYVISGAHTNSDPPGDIRVSKYEKSNTSNWRGIGNSLTNGILTDSKIYTYKLGNNGGWQTISQYGTDNLYKYLNSKAQLQETIGSGSKGDVYGLHFMDAQIGTDNLLTVPNATINGHTYTDYEMPRDSIDFNLKTPGYINVFAGTYFSGSQNGVNCFFSLHKIERDADQKITSIKEIKAIYDDNGTYNYQYVGESPPSGTKVFDTDCLTAPSNIRSDTVYYFEIPVGAGEFAIGSVNGKDGGYLLYLDISTHQGDSVITREKMVINTVEYELPKGVIFSGADRTVFEVPVSMTGNIVFTVNNGTVTATSPLTASSASSVKTIEKVTVSDQGGKFSIRRTTEGSIVTYEYSVRPLTPADSIEELAAYFNSSVNSAVYTYNYLLEGNNSVNNTSGDIEYSTDVGIAITRYVITARAVSEAVTATVQAIDSSASYIEFNGVTSIQTSQSITIPTQNNNS